MPSAFTERAAIKYPIRIAASVGLGFLAFGLNACNNTQPSSFASEYSPQQSAEATPVLLNKEDHAETTNPLQALFGHYLQLGRKGTYTISDMPLIVEFTLRSEENETKKPIAVRSTPGYKNSEVYYISRDFIPFLAIIVAGEKYPQLSGNRNVKLSRENGQIKRDDKGKELEVGIWYKISLSALNGKSGYLQAFDINSAKITEDKTP